RRGHLTRADGWPALATRAVLTAARRCTRPLSRLRGRVRVRVRVREGAVHGTDPRRGPLPDPLPQAGEGAERPARSRGLKPMIRGRILSRTTPHRYGPCRDGVNLH